MAYQGLGDPMATKSIKGYYKRERVHRTVRFLLPVFLNELQSAEGQKLFDIVDSLRKLDCHSELEPPQLVVCGSQSSGKSSVLEAISQLDFPRGNMTCTTFVTEIQFRRALEDNEGVDVQIRPDPSRSERVQNDLRQQRFSSIDLKQLANTIQEAEKKLLSVTGGSQSFWKDVLHVQIKDRHYQPLTLVDLPGIIELDDQQENIDIINEIVDHWIGQEQSIILPVVDAGNDLQRQSILTRVKKVDPNGERTFGIITKPDTVEAGSPLENFWIRRAQNIRSSEGYLNFEKGWHVLRNRNYQERKWSHQERDAAEKQFFENPKSNWHQVNSNYCGIQKLWTRLNKLLYEHTKKQLPLIRADIISRLEIYNKELSELREKLQKPDHLWFRYITVCEGLQTAATYAVDGVKDSTLREAEKKRERKVRTRIEEAHDLFFHDMVAKGNNVLFLGAENLSANTMLPNEYLEEVKDVMRENKGHELPGYSNSLIIGELFERYSSPWSDIAGDHIERSHAHCSAFIRHMITNYLQGRLPALPGRMTQKIIGYLEALLRKQAEHAREELGKLEEDRKRSPKTRNFVFEQKKARAQAETEQNAGLEMLDASENAPRKSDDELLITSRKFHSEFGQDAADRAAEQYGRDMLFFYNIARDRFIDNTINQVIERHLMAPLGGLFKSNLGITREEFDQILSDEDTRSLEDEKSGLEARIAGLMAFHTALVV